MWVEIFDVGMTDDSNRIASEERERKEGIRVEKVIPPKPVEDEDEQDEIEVKHGMLSNLKEVLPLNRAPKLVIQIKGKARIKGSGLLWRFNSLLGSMETLKLN